MKILKYLLRNNKKKELINKKVLNRIIKESSLCQHAIKELKLFNLISGVVKVISPLFIGFILTWLFYPLQKKLVDKGMNKALSAILIFILVAGFIILFVYIFIPVLYKQINDFITKHYIINNDLQYKTTNNKKLKTLINTYRGFRLANKLPSHGQNTHSNGKTAKK